MGLLSEPEVSVDPDTEVETISLNPTDSSQRDQSYDMCIASWAFWLIMAFNVGVVEPEDELTKMEGAVVTLITGLGPASGTGVDSKAWVLRVLSKTSCSLSD